MADNTKFVRTSFLNRVQDELEGTQGLTVRWPGVSFDTSGQDEWIEPSDLGFTPLAINANGTPRQESWTFQVSCFARMGESPDQTSVYRVDELADLVIDEFRWLALDVVDWDSGDPKPVIGTLQFLQPDVTAVSTATGSRGDQKTVTLPAHFDDA